MAEQDLLPSNRVWSNEAQQWLPAVSLCPAAVYMENLITNLQLKEFHTEDRIGKQFID